MNIHQRMRTGSVERGFWEAFLLRPLLKIERKKNSQSRESRRKMGSGLAIPKGCWYTEREPWQPAKEGMIIIIIFPMLSITSRSFQLLYTKATFKTSILRIIHLCYRQYFSHIEENKAICFSCRIFSHVIFNMSDCQAYLIVMKVLSGKGIHTQLLINTRGEDGGR